MEIDLENCLKMFSFSGFSVGFCINEVANGQIKLHSYLSLDANKCKLHPKTLTDPEV